MVAVLFASEYADIILHFLLLFFFLFGGELGSKIPGHSVLQDRLGRMFAW